MSIQRITDDCGLSGIASRYWVDMAMTVGSPICFLGAVVDVAFVFNRLSPLGSCADWTVDSFGTRSR